MDESRLEGLWEFSPAHAFSQITIGSFYVAEDIPVSFAFRAGVEGRELSHRNGVPFGKSRLGHLALTIDESQRLRPVTL